MKIYGIPNCNTVKKALEWLNTHQVPYMFHDFKKLGISIEKLQQWSAKVGYEKLINKKGATWRQLDETTQAEITSEQAALHLLQQKTSLIKRPVIEDGDFLFFGFDAEIYKKHFQSNDKLSV